MQMTRDNAAIVIVGTDVLVIFFFALAIFRLRWYEQLVEKDRQL